MAIKATRPMINATPLSAITSRDRGVIFLRDFFTPRLSSSLKAEPPARLSGKDLTPLLRGETDTLREAVYLQYENKWATDWNVPMRGIVTKNYKYVRYLEDGEELYDLRTDALEINNLIEDEPSRKLAGKMRKMLDQWLTNAEIDHKLP